MIEKPIEDLKTVRPRRRSSRGAASRLWTRAVWGALLTVGATAVQAEVVYSYNATDGYVTTEQPLRLADGTDFTSGSERPFSTNPMQPPMPAYTGPAFFGGFVNNADDDLTRVEVDNGGSSDTIDFGVRGNNVGWDAFIIGETTMDVVFDSTSSVVLANNRGGFGALGVRLVLRDTSGGYFISDTLLQELTSGGVTTDTFNATALDALTFSSYDPATSLAYVSNPSGFDPFVTSWDAVGVLLDYAFAAAGDRNTGVEFHQLTVDAVIPEPSSFVLSMLGLACLAMRSRR